MLIGEGLLDLDSVEAVAVEMYGTIKCTQFGSFKSDRAISVNRERTLAVMSETIHYCRRVSLSTRDSSAVRRL